MSWLDGWSRSSCPTPRASARSTATRERLQNDQSWCNQLLFHEYFNADTGEGLGASHQTGWTGLVATLIDELGRS